MAKAKLRLWECPNEKHAAVRAPSRPRRDDVRRYCLKCSEESGRLAERVCPSLERERKAATEKATAKRTQKAARARVAENEKWIVNCTNAAGQVEPVDVWQEVRRCINMKSLRRPSGRKLQMPHVKLHWRPNPGRAHANSWDDSLYFSVAHGMSAECLRRTVVHEVAHLVAPTPSKYRGRKRVRDIHGDAYKRILVEAYNERFPGVRCGTITNQTAYQIDARVAEQLKEQSRQTVRP